jgi:hypothetical protein
VNENIDLIKKWLQACDKDHKLCVSLREHRVEYSPDRLISVGLHDGKVQLVRCHTHLRYTYTALSYCWGRNPGALTDYMTTKVNAQDRLDGSPIGTLPKTLEDAIRVTKSLSIPYIWIDAICIIQGDKKDGGDWHHQASQMDKIFENAYLTLAVTSAASAWDGFLSRDQNFSVNIPFSTFPSRDGFGTMTMSYPAGGNLHNLVHMSPWAGRGWTLQEQMLSTRILYFTDHALYFECLHSQESESPAYIAPRQSNLRLLLEWQLSTKSSTSTYALWYRLIEEYTRRSLSLNEDKLTAIAGLANRLTTSTGEEYVCGLLKGDLVHGLLWQSSFHGFSTRTETMLLKRIENSQAPSWSWASLDGVVGWRFKDDISCCKVLPSSSEARLDLSGILIEAAKLVQLAKVDKLDITFIHDTLNEWKLDGLKVIILAREFHLTTGLLLEPIPLTKEYRRVGLVEYRHVEDPYHWHDDLKIIDQSTITLI